MFKSSKYLISLENTESGSIYNSNGRRVKLFSYAGIASNPRKIPIFLNELKRV